MKNPVTSGSVGAIGMGGSEVVAKWFVLYLNGKMGAALFLEMLVADGGYLLGAAVASSLVYIPVIVGFPSALRRQVLVWV